jgi:head-tail adaptor
MVSAATLTQIRDQREASLTDSCRIDRATDTTDSSSGYTQSWPAGSTVACNLTTPSSSPARAGGLIEILGTERGFIVALPYGTVITSADRIVSGGKTYEVIGVDKAGTFGVQVTAAVIELSE